MDWEGWPPPSSIPLYQIRPKAQGNQLYGLLVYSPLLYKYITSTSVIVGHLLLLSMFFSATS